MTKDQKIIRAKVGLLELAKQEPTTVTNMSSIWRSRTSRTKTKSPQTNGIVERFHNTVLDEFYRIAFRKKLYQTIGDLQADLDLWMREFNEARPHQGKWCFKKTPIQTFLDALPIAREKTSRALRPSNAGVSSSHRSPTPSRPSWGR